MKKTISILSYIWAALALIIAPATFFGNGYFSRTLAEKTGMSVHPKFSGGEVLQIIDHDTYKTHIHRPVFASLIGQAREGFVQINWSPKAALPAEIREGVDYDGDGKEDFAVVLDTTTGKAALFKHGPDVLSIENSYLLKDGWAVRVLLLKK